MLFRNENHRHSDSNGGADVRSSVLLGFILSNARDQLNKIKYKMFKHQAKNSSSANKQRNDPK